MRVRTKLILLPVFFTALFIFGFLSFRYSESRTLLALFKNEIAERKASFARLMKLEGRSLDALVHDYTIWDEMRDYISSGDKAWIENNVTQDTLSSFSACAVWIYKPDLALSYSINNLSDSEFPGLSLPKEFFSKLFKERSCYFFVNTAKGLMEIRASTIHPTTDIKRIKTPHGYFIAGRLWDTGYMAELSLLSDNKVRIRHASNGANYQDAGSSSEARIHFSRNLRSWDGSVLGYLDVFSSSNEISYFNKRSAVYLILFVLFALTAIGFGALFLWRWIGLPLHLISQTLKTENPNYLIKLKDSKNEFGDIAFLMANFFIQKTDLLRQIKERIDAELALQRQKKEQQVILNSVPAMVFYKDTQNRFIHVNKAFEDSMMMPKSALEGKFMHDVFPGEQSQTYWKDDKEVIESGIAKRNIIESMQTPGGLRWVQTDKVPYKDAEGNVVGIIGFSLDITERKRAEEEIRSLARFPEENPNLVLRIDANEKLLYMNQAVKTLMDKSGIVRQNILDILPVNIKELISDSLRNGSPVRDIEQDIDGAVYSLSMMPVPEMGYVNIYGLDITERKKAEEELKSAYEKLRQTENQLMQSEKMEVVGKIASGVAHEVKNPLAIILQGIDYLSTEKEIAMGKVTAGLLKKMNDAVLRADSIIKSLLNFSGVSELNISSSSISAALESSLLLVGHYLKKNHIEIVRDFKDDIDVKIDKNRMEQVFVNLLMNAVEAMPEGGILALRIYLNRVTAVDKGVGLRRSDVFRLGGKVAVVEIEDTGGGISPENLVKVFDPFFSTKRDKGGTGLGLSVVKNIIDLHQATIDISNRKDGKGAVAVLRFKV